MKTVKLIAILLFALSMVACGKRTDTKPRYNSNNYNSPNAVRLDTAHKRDTLKKKKKTTLKNKMVKKAKTTFKKKKKAYKKSKKRK